MSSKNESSRFRVINKTHTKIVDVDTPSNNSEATVDTSVIFTNLDSNSGDDRPNWKALVAKGEPAGNNVHANKTTFELEPFSCVLLIQRKRLNGNPPGRIVYRTELTEYLTKYYTSITAPAVGVHIAGTKEQAAANFVKKAQKRLSTNMQTGVLLGELAETLRMVRRPAVALRKGLRRYLDKVDENLKRNKRQSVRKRNAIVAETWLEAAFGWAPLLADAENAALSAGKVASGIHLHVTDMCQKETSVNEAGGSIAYPGAGSHAFDITVKTVTRSDVYGMFKPDFGEKVPFPDAFGLRPRDIIPTIWELIPWSFAVDYFTGIGDFISSMMFPTTALQWYNRSTHTKVIRSTSNYRVVGDMATETTNLSIRTTFASGKSVCTTETFDRETSSMIDLIRPVELRVFPDGWKPYVNLAALARARTIK